MDHSVRIYLKTMDSDGFTSHKNVGLAGLRRLLQERNPLIGLSVEANSAKNIDAKHYLYTLESGQCIKRHPLQGDFSLGAEFTCARTITDHFTSSVDSANDISPIVPKNANDYLFSENKKEILRLPLRTCFLIEGVDVLQDEDPHTVNSIFNTLFSAGFITHALWKDNLTLLLKNKNKLAEIASALFALHEVGFLNQKIFTATVEHEKPWRCASGLRELTLERFRKTTKEEKYIRVVDFTQVNDPDDDLFCDARAECKTKYNQYVNCVINHPHPLDASRIIAMLYHRFEKKFDTKIVSAIARIKDQVHLNDLRKILLCMHESKILNKKNCLRLLKENPLKYPYICSVVNRQLKLGSKLALNEELFECILAFDEDPQILVSKLAKFPDPVVPVALFARLTQTGIGTLKNLDVLCQYPNIQRFDRLLNEVVAADIAITQTIFDLLYVHPDSTNQSAIEILALTAAGRNELRKNLTTEKGEFLFGSAKISPEILAILVENKTIGEWLAISTESEFTQKAHAIINAIEAEIAPLILKTQSDKKSLFEKFVSNQSRLFSLRCNCGMAGSAAVTGERHYSAALAPVLQDLVYGKESEVKEALEAAKENPEKLLALLCNTSTVTDYSGRTITDTLFKAALRAGDVEMCQMLTPYFDLIPNGRVELELQFAEVFFEGMDTHDTEQQQNTFNFDNILAVIEKASPAELAAALNKTGAQFVQSDDACAKPNDQLTLIEALNRFREEFARLSLKEKFFNPYHLLRAYEMYSAFWNQCECDGSDTDHKKRNLFWCQIVGYVQRFMPACYAQAFVQGLWNLVKVDGYQFNDWRPKLLERFLKFKDGPNSCFPLSDLCSGLGFDFGICGGEGGWAPPAREVNMSWRAGMTESVTAFYKILFCTKNQVFKTSYETCTSIQPQI